MQTHADTATLLDKKDMLIKELKTSLDDLTSKLNQAKKAQIDSKYNQEQAKRATSFE